MHSKPDFRIVYISNLGGITEPCGCTSKPLGGIDRVMHLSKTLMQETSSALLLSGPTLCSGPGACEKSSALLSILQHLSPHMFVPEHEAALLSDNTLVNMLHSNTNEPTLLTQGDRAVALWSIQLTPDDPGIHIAEALQQYHRRYPSRQQIVLVQGSRRAAQEIRPHAQLVLLSGTATPLLTGAPPSGMAPLWTAGKHGEHVLQIDFFENGIEGHVHEIIKSLPRDSEASLQLLELNRNLNERNRAHYASWTPLQVSEGQAAYTGSRACASCHDEAFAWWQTTAHGNAYRTLERENKEFHTDCASCHVTGYNKPSGSTLVHPIQNVGCESCHGPGSLHQASPDSIPLQTHPRESVCVTCHTPEHSDLFEYQTYVQRMIAPGHGIRHGMTAVPQATEHRPTGQP